MNPLLIGMKCLTGVLMVNLLVNLNKHPLPPEKLPREAITVVKSLGVHAGEIYAYRAWRLIVRGTPGGAQHIFLYSGVQNVFWPPGLPMSFNRVGLGEVEPFNDVGVHGFKNLVASR